MRISADSLASRVALRSTLPTSCSSLRDIFSMRLQIWSNFSFMSMQVMASGMVSVFFLRRTLYSLRCGRSDMTLLASCRAVSSSFWLLRLSRSLINKFISLKSFLSCIAKLFHFFRLGCEILLFVREATSWRLYYVVFMMIDQQYAVLHKHQKHRKIICLKVLHQSDSRRKKLLEGNRRKQLKRDPTIENLIWIVLILRVLFSGIGIIMEIFGPKREKAENVRQNLIEQQSKRSHQIFKNRLLLTSILNLLIFLIFVFAMSYYKWSLISIPIYFVDQAAQKVSKGDFNFYVNLLYAKQVEQPHYQSFPSLADEICVQNDIYCESAFVQLAFVGYLSFGILVLGASFQVWDIYKMMLYFIGREKQADFREEKQDNLRHILTIGHFLIGISLNIYGLAEMEVQVQLGASFWTFVGGLVAFIIIIIYEQIALTHIRRQKLILKLMQGEREITNQISASMELSSEGDFYI